MLVKQFFSYPSRSLALAPPVGPACHPTPRSQQCVKCQAAATQAEQIKAETYLGEKFTKTVPAQPGKWETQELAGSPIQIQRLDHSAIEVTDVQKSVKFYTNVLGFKQLARPGFPFGGAWLSAGGLVLHLIERDPSVERRVPDKKDIYSNDAEPWYVRRSEHKAFQVADLSKTEETLGKLGIEFHKFIVPGTNAAQIFLYDPDLNGIELGANYSEIADHLKDKGRHSS